jgi:PQQ-dependent catabolism-associated CXXCW motif protein
VRAAAIAVLLGVAAGAVAAPPEPDGYRTADYLAPVPETLAGAIVLDTPTAETWWREGRAVFVDVMPRTEKPEGLPEGTIWRDRPRDSIPGAVWAPNTGYGRLTPEADAYLRAVLAPFAGRPLVFFCMTDCWMSWNAARRAILEYGLAEVAWYPDGADGWAMWGLPLERVEPAPRP